MARFCPAYDTIADLRGRRWTRKSCYKVAMLPTRRGLLRFSTRCFRCKKPMAFYLITQEVADSQGRGMQGLARQVQVAQQRDPHAGDLYVFRGRSGSLVKILWHDGIGMSLYAK